jgi:cytochrome c-type biogenesis protein CcmH/NrfG
MTSEEREALEAEREFLLRSLEDLEAERAAGEIDPERYQTLRDDYTARAAAVLRTLEGSTEATPPAPAPAPPRRRRVMAWAGVVVFGAVAGLVLAGTMGERLPGGTATGNQQTAEGKEASPKPDRAALERAVAERPNDPEAHLTLARFLLSTNDVVGAVKEFDTTARLDPRRAEAWAYSGWVFYLASRSDAEHRAELIDRAMERLDQAVAVDENFPDGRFFRGMVLFRGKGDAAAAVVEFEKFLALLPPGSAVAEQVRPVLEEARKKAAGG